jgi:hypothetical protein
MIDLFWVCPCNHTKASAMEGSCPESEEKHAPASEAYAAVEDRLRAPRHLARAPRSRLRMYTIAVA